MTISNEDKKSTQKSYAPSSNSSSALDSSDERAYNSESTETDEKPNSQDRRFIADSSVSSEYSFKPSSDYTDEEPFIVGSFAPIKVKDSKDNADYSFSSTICSQESDYSDVVFLEKRKIGAK